MRILLLSTSLAMLCCVGCQSRINGATGYKVALVGAVHDYCLDADKGRIFAIAMPNHRARLNTEFYDTYPEMAARLHEVLSHRAERVVLVTAEPAVEWGEFLEMLDQLNPEVTRMGIITPRIEELLKRYYCERWPISTLK